jgi:hypothetical protein
MFEIRNRRAHPLRLTGVEEMFMATMRRSITRTSLVAAAVLVGGVAVETAAPAPPVHAAARPSTRQVTIPAGTILRVRLDRALGSDISRVEETVPGTLARAVMVGGRTILPAGSAASGYVAQATRPGRVKGRGRLAVRFTRITPAGADTTYRMQTRAWTAIAPATKKKDAYTIGLPAAGGAAIGAIASGKKGAGVGALVGGGAGTVAVLSTRGKEVRVGRGATIAVRLTAPLTVTVDDVR